MIFNIVRYAGTDEYKDPIYSVVSGIDVEGVNLQRNVSNTRQYYNSKLQYNAEWLMFVDIGSDIKPGDQLQGANGQILDVVDVIDASSQGRHIEVMLNTAETIHIAPMPLTEG